MIFLWNFKLDKRFYLAQWKFHLATQDSTLCWYQFRIYVTFGEKHLKWSKKIEEKAKIILLYPRFFKRIRSRWKSRIILGCLWVVYHKTYRLVSFFFWEDQILIKSGDNLQNSVIVCHQTYCFILVSLRISNTITNENRR